MNRKTLLSIGSALVAIGVMSVAGYGCGDDDSTATAKADAGGTGNETGTGTETGTGNETGTKNPAPPALGAQIDRMGRPAINTALNAVFVTDAGVQGAAKDKYNQDTDQANWGKTWIGETSKNLAIFDSLDTKCGNSLLANPDAGASPTAVQVYGGLGGVTADDRIWLNAAGKTCNIYLGVEAEAVGVVPPGTGDCGGRALKYDVIDTTYSVVSIGAPGGVGDGIDADPVKTAATAFPFLANPLP